MKIVIFHHGVLVEGGGERITLEENQYLEAMGNDTILLTFYFTPDIYNGRYKVRVRNIHPVKKSPFRFIWLFQKVLALRKAIKEIKPDVIIGSGEEGCAYLALSTFGMKIPYSAHIHQTIFWDIQNYGDIWDDNKPLALAKYTYVFHHVYNEIRNSVIGHQRSFPEKPPVLDIKKRLIAELLAILLVIGVRRARNIFVLSQQMAWEVKKLYGKTAISIKGAFPAEVLNYISRKDIKNNLGISNRKVVLSICRLTPKKRVDLTIKAFKLVVERNPNACLIVGGTGSEEENLKVLVKSLKISHSVIFTGFIKEDQILDYYSCCDVFISADHADFDITPYVALGLKKKVVWSVENEIDVELEDSGYIFPAEPDPQGFARAIDNALQSADVKEIDMSRYSWECYFASINKYLGEVINQD